ncbi:MAG: hypothetical protein JO037_08995 [Actinobacteria bacterium]|nr:hypothetical protein [Actinomycetota bacterium]
MSRGFCGDGLLTRGFSGGALLSRRFLGSSRRYGLRLGDLGDLGGRRLRGAGAGGLEF